MSGHARRRSGGFTLTLNTRTCSVSWISSPRWQERGQYRKVGLRIACNPESGVEIAISGANCT
eukprot:5616053-Prymnesium_polylepis.1